ncbi:MAG: dihydropteroate synthase [Spirochaetes bacterium]|jgi:dihydropteroate synthase|nr:dihydropteroate synthase [Spirochaetota bacterium]
MKVSADIKIMGIVNITPDSFFDGNHYYDSQLAIDHALRLIDEGADIIDVGGESTRPGAASVSAKEEIGRVIPVIKEVVRLGKVPVSVDTTKAEVAKAALDVGAAIINDISGMTFDTNMADIVASYNATIVLMHTPGRPDVMMQRTDYTDVVEEVVRFLEEQITYAIDKGISRNKIIVDPGIGFGKSVHDNYQILSSLDSFLSLGYPLLIGLSRKSLIGALYETAEDRLPATIALNSIALYCGATIIRVHDVKEHKLAFESLKMLKTEKV